MDMTPPNVKFVTLKEEMEYLGESMEVDELVQITFNLEIGDLLQSKMYQILPISEAKEMVSDFCIQWWKKKRLPQKKLKKKNCRTSCATY